MKNTKAMAEMHQDGNGSSRIAPLISPQMPQPMVIINGFMVTLLLGKFNDACFPLIVWSGNKEDNPHDNPH